MRPALGKGDLRSQVTVLRVSYTRLPWSRDIGVYFSPVANSLRILPEVDTCVQCLPVTTP